MPYLSLKSSLFLKLKSSGFLMWLCVFYCWGFSTYAQDSQPADLSIVPPVERALPDRMGGSSDAKAVTSEDLSFSVNKAIDPIISMRGENASENIKNNNVNSSNTSSLDKMGGLDDAKVINPGDLLSITITEDRDGPQTVLVDEQGMVMVPYAGAVPAKGKTAKQLAYEIKDQLEKTFYNKATVLVAPATQTGTRGRIFVLGQVTTPGPVKIPTDEILTASRAILEAGALTTADLTRVSIVRKDPKNPGKEIKMNINVNDVINNGRFDQDVIVRANDLIFVPTQGASVGEVLMSGAIRQPGPLAIPIGDKFMLTNAIFRAGGFGDFADKERVKIIRNDATEEGGQKTITVNVSKVLKGERDLDQPLHDGDTVIVPEKWFNF